MPEIHEKVLVYSPDSGMRNIKKVINELIQDFGQANSLGWRLFLRDLRGMYRNSILGYFWSLAPALTTALIWIFLQGQRVVSFGDTGVPYPVYVLTSMMLWMMFQESIMTPMQSTQMSQMLLNKLNFPRESILYSALYMTFFNSALKLSVIVLVFVVFQLTPTWNVLLGLMGMVMFLLFGFTVGIWLVPLSILYRDVQKGIPIGLRLFMYLTPVIYAVPKQGLIAKLMAVNPLVPMLETTRDWLLNTQIEYLQSFILVTVIMVVFLLLGLFLYKLAMPIVIERLGAGK